MVEAARRMVPGAASLTMMTATAAGGYKIRVVARVLAIDIGTSSIRATLQRLSTPSHLSSPWRGSEQLARGDADPTDELADRQRRRSVEAGALHRRRSSGRAGRRRLIDGALDGVKTRVDAVAIGAFWHSLVGVDGQGRAVTAVIPWSDTRSAREVAVAARAARRARHPRAHGMPPPSDLLAGAAALVRRARAEDVPPRPPVDVASRRYLQRRWLGRDAESVSQASGTGMFLHDGSAWGWDPELCAACDVTPDQLGAIVDLDDQSAEPTAAIARRWPQLRGARWIPAAADGALDNVGAGCTTGGRAALMIGTSGALRKIWTTDTRAGRAVRAVALLARSAARRGRRRAQQRRQPRRLDARRRSG